MAEDGIWVSEVGEEVLSRKYVVLQGEGEWSALYVDGDLKRAGDHYLIEEELRIRLGVVTVQSNDFLRGGFTYNDVAPTLIAVREYSDLRKGREATVAQLRKEAARLLAQAAELDKEQT